MSTMNFCRSEFGTSVSSDKVTVDGHEAVNLVTINKFLPKGFLVENFVRSPANLTFEFPCNIEIDRIVINGVVGSQQSCGYEIFTNSKPRTGEQLLNPEKGSAEQGAGPGNDSRVYTSVGKFNQLGMETFTFRYPYFKPRIPFSKLKCMDVRHFEPSKHAETMLRSKSVHHLTSVSSLTIRVNRVAPGCVAAIRWVEIWGQPSRAITKPVVQKIMEIQKQLTTPQFMGEGSSTQNKGKLSTSSPDIDENIVKVPDEFKDAITFEVMMIPILLPSGHSVDQSTLEKHNREQAHWGRAPNDPFTGKVFTQTSKPVPHTALKVRIDQFLLKYGDQLSVMSRTLGSANHTDQHRDGTVATSEGFASLNSACNLTTTKSVLLGNICPSERGAELVEKRNLDSEKKGKKRNLSAESTPRQKQRKTPSVSKTMIDLTEDQPDLVDLTQGHDLDSQKVKGHTRSDHERKLGASLDDALDSALGALPSFEKPKFSSSSSSMTSAQPSQMGSGFHCSRCGTVLPPNGTYRPPCGHCVCRACLNPVQGPSGNPSDLVCFVCQRNFHRKDVVLVHQRVQPYS